MVTFPFTGNISREATVPLGNIYCEATRTELLPWRVASRLPLAHAA